MPACYVKHPTEMDFHITPPFMICEVIAFAWGDNVSSTLKYSTRYYVPG